MGLEDVHELFKIACKMLCVCMPMPREDKIHAVFKGDEDKVTEEQLSQSLHC